MKIWTDLEIEYLKQQVDQADDAARAAWKAREEAGTAHKSARQKGLKCEAARWRSLEKATKAWEAATKAETEAGRALRTARLENVIQTDSDPFNRKLAELWYGDHLIGQLGLGYEPKTDFARDVFRFFREAIVAKGGTQCDAEVDEALQTILRCNKDFSRAQSGDERVSWAIEVATWKRRRAVLIEELSAIEWPSEDWKRRAIHRADEYHKYASDARELAAFIVEQREKAAKEIKHQAWVDREAAKARAAAVEKGAKLLEDKLRESPRGLSETNVINFLFSSGINNIDWHKEILATLKGQGGCEIRDHGTHGKKLHAKEPASA